MISLIFKEKEKKKPKQKQISKGNKHFDRKPKKKKKKRVLRCVRNNLSQFNWQHGLRILEQNKRSISNFIKQIAY